MEEQVLSFHEQATIIQQWDQQLLGNLTKLMTLQQSVSTVQLSHQKLQQVLDGIRISQSDLITMLDALERQVDVLQQQQRSRPQSNDELSRQRTYELAEEVDDRLNVLNDSLSFTVEQLNNIQAKQQDPHNPVTKILKILNVHTASLQYLENAATEIERQLQQTNVGMNDLQSNSMSVGMGMDNRYQSTMRY